MEKSANTIVEIPQGKLRGKADKSVFGTEFYCFHRIPYAKPPVGELRFKAPQPAGKWEGILDATQDGPVCPSTDFNNRQEYQDASDEDSLFINVYCKQNPNDTRGKKYPVMVWIHGGGFEFGSGNRAMSGPDYFMLHDVIVVSFNYRLGVLGFLSLQTVECPGNYGLKDQQLVLRWVKDNIAHFGGDPDNITVFGLSAGGASVHYQLLCLSNEGLFKRAIAQSGTAVLKWAFSRCPRENAFLLGKRMGCDTQDDKVLLDFLKKAPAKDIVLNSQGIIEFTEGLAIGERNLNVTFMPTAEPEHEGAFITKHPWVLLREGKQLNVPLITGLCTAEMIFGFKTSQKLPELKNLEDFQELIPKDLPLKKNSEASLALAKRLKEMYFKNGTTLDNVVEVTSDIYFNYGAYKTIKSRKNCNSPTYLYLFTYSGDQKLFRTTLGLYDIKGTCHGEDVPYFWRSIFSNMKKMTPGSRDYNFMLRYTKLWTSFATTGVPSAESVEWKKTSPEGLEYLEIGEKFVMKEGLMRNRMLFWDEIYTANYDR